MNFEQACDNMIKQQLRTNAVLDDGLLNLIRDTPRHYFVPEQYEEIAYADTTIPLAHGQAMMLPRDESIMLQSLAIKNTDKVLEIGTGSGYVTALLGELAHYVCSVEIFEDIAQQARANLRRVGVMDANVVVGDAARGWNNEAPYDVIVITGGLYFLTPEWRDLLNVGGRLFAIVGDSPAMQAQLFTKLAADRWEKRCLFETDIMPLVNAPQKDAFVF
ncbi:MAG: protein-L-isoaspartate O-methyltransferase [Gammaproteobacteria bacterium]